MAPLDGGLARKCFLKLSSGTTENGSSSRLLGASVFPPCIVLSRGIPKLWSTSSLSGSTQVVTLPTARNPHSPLDWPVSWPRPGTITFHNSPWLSGTIPDWLRLNVAEQHQIAITGSLVYMKPSRLVTQQDVTMFNQWVIDIWGDVNTPYERALIFCLQ